VDDEESQRTALAGMIAVWGYAEETAADGEEAADDCEFCANLAGLKIVGRRREPWAMMGANATSCGSEGGKTGSGLPSA
jgi:hypothetical protein